MARPREFDEDEVVDRALSVFWTKGYEATSLTDLMEATGLAKGSVYKGFGDKRSFFLRTLDRYMARGRERYHALDDGTRQPLSLLREWIMTGLAQSSCEGVRRGCFAVNCVVELAPHDAEIRKRLRAHERRIEAMYAATLARGQREGSLRPDFDPQQAARWLSAVVSGVQVKAKAGLSPREAEALVDFSLATFRWPR